MQIHWRLSLVKSGRFPLILESEVLVAVNLNEKIFMEVNVGRPILCIQLCLRIARTPAASSPEMFVHRHTERLNAVGCIIVCRWFRTLLIIAPTTSLDRINPPRIGTLFLIALNIDPRSHHSSSSCTKQMTRSIYLNTDCFLSSSIHEHC